MGKIAALFVLEDGPYSEIKNVELWGISRDARKYQGPWPVVAHPPCERWGRYWSGGPSVKVRKKLGDDAGCFASALKSVRKYGGVLEHPEASHAWKTFGLAKPPKSGGWIRADKYGWTCCVEQGAYGHKARKATWLYVVGASHLPELKWGKRPGVFLRLDDGFHSSEERAIAPKAEPRQKLSKRQRLETPLPFRNLLLRIAGSVRGKACPKKKSRQFLN